jgi:hypothetical protein
MQQTVKERPWSLITEATLDEIVGRKQWAEIKKILAATKSKIDAENALVTVENDQPKWPLRYAVAGLIFAYRRRSEYRTEHHGLVKPTSKLFESAIKRLRAARLSLENRDLKLLGFALNNADVWDGWSPGLKKRDPMLWDIDEYEDLIKKLIKAERCCEAVLAKVSAKQWPPPQWWSSDWYGKSHLREDDVLDYLVDFYLELNARRKGDENGPGVKFVQTVGAAVLHRDAPSMKPDSIVYRFRKRLQLKTKI